MVRSTQELARLRAGLRDWLGELGVTRATSDELVLAVTELTTNALEASPDVEATVDADAGPDQVRVVVANRGPVFDGSFIPSHQQDPLRVRGRGLELATSFVDSVTFARSDDLTEVTIVKAIP